MTSSVSEILLLSKTANFPFRTMDYSPWSSKNLISWNRLKKFMQVGIDVTCMYIDFGGCDLSSFGDTTTLKNGQFFLLDHGRSRPAGLVPILILHYINGSNCQGSLSSKSGFVWKSEKLTPTIWSLRPVPLLVEE